MICECGATFRRLHPDENHCRCGAIYDGQGNEISEDYRTLKSKREKSSLNKPIKQLARKPHSHPVVNAVFSNYNKPGSALQSLIPEWVVQSKEGCGCKDYSKKMDAWGTIGCIAHQDEIISHLMEQSDRLIPVFRGLPQSFRKAAAKKLLAKAIDISKEK